MALFSNKFITICTNLENTRPILYIKGLLKNLPECLIGTWHYIQLKLWAHVKTQKIALVVEVNSFHGETLPGYVEYLQKLGYNVVVLTRYVSWKDSPFVRLTMKPQHYCLTIWGMRQFLKSKKIHEFDFVLYNSAHLYLNEYRFYGRVTDFLGVTISSGKKGFALIEHSLKPGTDLEYFQKMPEDSQQKRILFQHSFVLTPQTIEKHIIPMLSPCSFGKIKEKDHINNKRIFITIGNISSHSRNFNQLFEILENVPNDSDFEVWIIGRILEKEIVKSIPTRVKILGRLTFAEMYNRLEQADFFLPLLDPQTQPLYLNGCTSGSRQLILGFKIPPIIHKLFAEHYGFTQDSCFTYTSKESFEKAFIQTLKISNDEYLMKRKKLTQLFKNVYSESINNLKNCIDKNDSYCPNV